VVVGWLAEPATIPAAVLVLIAVNALEGPGDILIRLFCRSLEDFPARLRAAG